MKLKNKIEKYLCIVIFFIFFKLLKGVRRQSQGTHNSNLKPKTKSNVLQLFQVACVAVLVFQKDFVYAYI